MIRHRVLFALVLAWIAFPALAYGQSDLRDPPAEQVDQAKAISEAAQTAMAGADSHARWQANFIERSFEWHLLSTKIIFWVVILVVVFGLVVSWLQFRHDTDRTAAPSESKDNAPAYDISASAQQFSVKSKTIGAVVLVFSGIFFFLYLSIVYPMNETSACEVVGNCNKQ